MRNIFFVILNVLILTACSGQNADSCLMDKYQAYADAQRTWQESSTNVVIELAPEYEEVANLYMNEQLLRIERREMAFKLLLTSNPEKINTHQKLSQWVELNDELLAQLSREYPTFAEIHKSVEAQSERAPHPDGDNLRSILRENIINTPDFQQAASELQRKTNEIEKTDCDAT